MRNRVFMKIVPIPNTDYQAEIVCNSPRDGEFNLYGRLQHADGKPVPNVKLVRKNANSMDEAKRLLPKMVYDVSCEIPERSKPKASQKNIVHTSNEIDAVVQKMLDNEVVFYTEIYAGSKRQSWNWGTHKSVYTYWLNHGISDLLLRMAESEDPYYELQKYRNERIDATYNHGRSNKNRDKAAQTVDINLMRANILLHYLRKEHPEFPAFDLTKCSFLARAVPEEQMKYLPEPLCRYLTSDLDASVGSEPHLVLCAVLMYDGALRTAEAAGISIRCIAFYESYCVIKVLSQEKGGERIDRLKTDNAYRHVVLSYWAMTMIQRCLDVLNLGPDDELPLVRAEELSRWIRKILYKYDSSYMENAEKIQRTNPDYDDTGKPIYDISAYVLRRNAASRWLNYDGLTHDEIDIMLGHKEKDQRPEIYLLDETHQREIAAKLERYVYNPNCTKNPAFSPLEITPQYKIDLEPYTMVKIVNTSDQPLRVHSDLTACCPTEAIKVRTPSGSTSEVICRSVKLRPKSRIVISSNFADMPMESEKQNEEH